MIALIALPACATWSSIHSETYIDAGQSFLLGGAQRGPFQATVTNTGGVPVRLLVEADGVRRSVIVLAPDSTIDAEFRAHETAVFSNASQRRAVITVNIRGTGSRELGMRYDSTGRSQ
jgi:hypothetical protein